MKMITIAIKELTDQVRDRRTIAASIILPAVIVPLLLLAISGSTVEDKTGSPVRIAITPGNDHIVKVISEQFKGTEFISPANAGNLVLTGEADLQIENNSLNGKGHVIKIIFDPARKHSVLSNIRVARLLESVFSTRQIISAGTEIKSTPIRGDSENRTLLTLSLIIPVFLTVFAASSSITAAVDISAGEKERSTIEAVLSSSISHSSIIAGKITAASIIGFISTISLMSGLCIGSLLLPEITGGIALIKFCGIRNISLLVAAAFVSVVLFSSAGIAIGFFARSVKEGTIFILPVIVLSSVLSSGLIAGDPFHHKFYVNYVPLLNTASLMRSIVFNHYMPAQFIISISVNVVCVLLLYLAGCSLLGNEKVIFRS